MGSLPPALLPPPLEGQEASLLPLLELLQLFSPRPCCLGLPQRVRNRRRLGWSAPSSREKSPRDTSAVAAVAAAVADATPAFAAGSESRGHDTVVDFVVAAPSTPED